MACVLTVLDGMVRRRIGRPFLGGGDGELGMVLPVEVISGSQFRELSEASVNFAGDCAVEVAG